MLIEWCSVFPHVCEEWPSGLRHWNKNQNITDLNLLDAWQGLGTEPHCEGPGDLWVEIVKNAVINTLTVTQCCCPLNNSNSWSWGSQVYVWKTFFVIVVKNDVLYWYLVLWTFFLSLHSCHWKNYNFPWKVLEKSWNFLLKVVWPPC